MSLASKDCIPCRGGVPSLDAESVARFSREVPLWTVVDGHHLSRTVPFADWASGLAWVNRVAALADEVGHHPELTLSWGKVHVEVWTHKIDGLTESDFIFAAKCDRIAPTP